MIIDYDSYNTFSGNPVRWRITNVTKEKYDEIKSIVKNSNDTKIVNIIYESELETKW